MGQMRAFITGLSGKDLTASEERFLADFRPAGLIIFARNVGDAEQLKRLIASARAAAGNEDDFLVLIDQEGGRVQRIRSPMAHNLPAAAAIAELYAHNPQSALDAAFSIATLAAQELASFGINMNCAPVVDVPVADAHDVIGDRAYGQEPEQIIALARAVARGLMAGGVTPVIKHIPGHGRAKADSHLELPVVDTPHDVLSKTDFVPFKALTDLPAAMTAHVVYSALDAANPASTSARVTQEVMRGEIGFDGLLMSDDLSMRALSGPMAARAAAVIAAGSDLALHCNGDMSEMRDVAENVPELDGQARQRLARAAAASRQAKPLETADARKLLEAMMRETSQRV